jgi:hypothetical protein
MNGKVDGLTLVFSIVDVRVIFVENSAGDLRKQEYHRIENVCDSFCTIIRKRM